MRRFLMAASTYVLGFAILAMCAGLGLLDRAHLLWIGGSFVVVNLVFFTLLRSGWNLQLQDPSMTAQQICAGAAQVFVILILADRLHFLAGPFYSVLFVFGMLQLRARTLVWVEIFVLTTYFLAMALRIALFQDRLDLRVEAVNAVVVVGSSVWYAVAAGYISDLRGRLRESLRTIEQLAIRDALTDTWNRRHLDALLFSEVQRCERLRGRLTACMVDVDHFKNVNDRYGHATGDEVLKGVAAGLKAQLRSIDELGRFGGEEFLLLLPGTSADEALICAERLRAAVAALPLLPEAGARVTVSIGLAEFAPGDTPATLVERADRALYRAKRGGRDRVVVDGAAGAVGMARAA